jgi:hypothetical protein
MIESVSLYDSDKSNRPRLNEMQQQLIGVVDANFGDSYINLEDNGRRSDVRFWHT